MANKIITAFGSGFTKPEDPYYNEALELGKTIAGRGWTTVSGGYYGIMEAILKGAKSAGGKTIGVTVSTWSNKPNDYIDDEVNLDNLMERIVELIGLADAYLIFKGGTGTLVEISVALELMNKKSIPEKPIYFYGDFWKGVIEILKLDSVYLKGLIDRNIFYVYNSSDLEKYLK